MIFTDTSVANVGRAEHCVVSSCVAQKTDFPKMLFAFFFLCAKNKSCEITLTKVALMLHLWFPCCTCMVNGFWIYLWLTKPLYENF